ncbi:hypothetical protein LPW11_00715 [Geomonas sp. RF6]|uniref:hypothetical protein n=1 Tax=Geomonas sp. RF6 TaxID=2897342 RepID=UPI001E3AFC74|nr:hypothetical protein [Geomonas sp. RF6]UFS70726.1 hypothetical protein LPW11_00715 [Geomonas sp. RF6]
MSLPARKMAQRMRGVAALGGADPEREVERWLEGELLPLAPKQRLERLEELAAELGLTPAPALPSAHPAAMQEIGHLVSRFLGGADAAEGLPPEILAEKFAASLDALFDSLNQIVSVINVTLLGQSPELETIRKVIGSNLKDGGDLPIREYLERIRSAFLAAHESFQSAAATVLSELLGELDPEREANGTPLKFRPLRKAELFEQAAERHRRCRRWFDSGEWRERLLREFEKECRRDLQGREGRQ